MALRCPCLMDEHIGSDSMVVCRRAIARQKRITCPRRRDQWQIHESCFDLQTLIRKPDGSLYATQELRDLLYPESAMIAGTGEVTKKVPE